MIVASTNGARAMPTATTKPFPPPPLLSRRQAQLVEVVERLTAENGFPPSVREIAAVMNVHHSRVNQLIATAAARGAITRDPGKMRSVRVIHRPAR
jgi:SOS-response transcriptional repressor LexA